MEEKHPSAQSSALSEQAMKTGERIAPILAHFKTDNRAEVTNKIREQFARLWEMEKGDDLDPAAQLLTTVVAFIYSAHNILDDYNIKPQQARDMIAAAFAGWLAPVIEAQTSAEKTSANPFKSFVESNQSKIDEVYTWENFFLETQKADEKAWTYKMRRCWFQQFFIRYGRPDYLPTACEFDQIPARARKDYVNLKLDNLFTRWGQSCTFQYSPVKK